MMNDIKFVKLQPKHASITPYLRKADIDEIYAMTGLPPEVAVAFSIANTERGFAVELDNKVVAIFGVSQGIIWLVGTDEITKHPVIFYRLSKKIFTLLKKGYTYLENYVDTRNKLSLKWLKWLGFTVEPPQKINNGIFHHVYWEEE